MDGSERRRLILLEIMQRKNITPQKLSQRAGINYTSIMQFRNGDKKLNSIPMLERLSLGLGEPVTVFFPEAMSETQRSMEKMKQEILTTIQSMVTATPTPPLQITNRPFQPAAAPAKKNYRK